MNVYEAADYIRAHTGSGFILRWHGNPDGSGEWTSHRFRWNNPTESDVFARGVSLQDVADATIIKWNTQGDSNG